MIKLVILLFFFNFFVSKNHFFFFMFKQRKKSQFFIRCKSFLKIIDFDINVMRFCRNYFIIETFCQMNND